MFKLPNGPSSCAKNHELADFAELLAIQKGSLSFEELLSILNRGEDYGNANRLLREEELEQRIVDTYGELELRRNLCGGGYPFDIILRGNTLQKHTTPSHQQLIYVFMLLATRLNMATKRSQNGIDATHLFEKLSAIASENYLGDNAISEVFGYPNNPKRFDIKVDKLCNKIGEGGGFSNHTNSELTVLDGGLDFVTWKNFNDNRQGKLIIFGQSKTGTEYSVELSSFDPEEFVKLWINTSFAVSPIRMCCIAEALLSIEWHKFSIKFSLLLDRCRLVSLLKKPDGVILDEVRSWTSEALKIIEI